MKKAPEEIDPARARILALQWLTRREHSRFELQQKLLQKGCAPEIAEQALARLASERLLNDERFVESFIASRRRRGIGPVRVRRELEQKGISADTIELQLDPAERGWLELLQELRRKRFGSNPPKSYAERAKQARFLQYRGFTMDQIQQILKARNTDDL